MRLYSLLLRLLPASFRDEYGDELKQVFARQHRDATGIIARTGLWIMTIIDVFANSVRVHMDVLRQDLRQSMRTLRRSPGFATAAIIVIALGVGATTAAFTLTDYVLLRALPFPDADRLVKIWQGAVDRPASARGLQGTNDVSPALYVGWKDRSKSFESMGALAFASSNLTGSGEPERLDGAAVTFNALPTIGISPAMGRVFTEVDDESNAPCVVLISDAMWRQRFGAERSALGSRIRLDEESCEVVGVMPARFEFPSRKTQFWRPIRFGPDASSDFGDNYLRVIARLKPDVSFDQATAELAIASDQLARSVPADRPNTRAVMIGLRDEMNEQSRMLLIAMTGAAACLLLIACTNLASLTIARASTRGRELAVRTALGAGKRRLVRQLLTESVMLAAIGGAIGLLIAIGTIPTAVRLVPTALPIAETPDVDLRMLAIAAIATLATGIGFGVLPAFRAASRAASADVRDGSRTGTSLRATKLRGTLVVAQVAASIVLLVGAGLLIRAMIRVQATPAGFDSTGVLTMRTFLPWSKYGFQSARSEFYRRVLDDVSALPGVTATGYTSYLPMTMRGGVWNVVIPGRAVDRDRPELAGARFVTPQYFRAMGIPLITGRGFDASDSAQSQPVAIVSQSFVSSYLNGSDALGRTFEFGPAGKLTIVGVVGDVKFRGLERRNEPQVYMSHQQQGDNQTMGYVPKDLVVRLDPTHNDDESAAALVPAIRRIISNADPSQPISDVQPLAAIVEGETVSRAVQVRVLGAFAALSCLLAVVGLHGLLTFVVSARTREFGVRLALGARPRQLLTMVAGRGVVLGIAGIVAGLVIAYPVARWLESLLAGVSPADPGTLSVVVVVSLLLCVAGSLLPAIRASRTSPREAIQSE